MSRCALVRFRCFTAALGALAFVLAGCSGEAVSTQVLYLDHAPTALLDNVAVAWDQGCTLCTATSVSVQVVVVSAAGTLIRYPP